MQRRVLGVLIEKAEATPGGYPMTGPTLLATLEFLGVARSYSRPGVCDDDSYSEATFHTVNNTGASPIAHHVAGGCSYLGGVLRVVV